MTVIEGVVGTREGREQYCTHLAGLAPPFLQLQPAEPLYSICLIAHSESAPQHDPEQIQPPKNRNPAECVTHFFIGKPLGRSSPGF